MADTKFTGLTAITNPTGNDIVPIVDAVDTTPVSRKIKVGDLIEGGFTTTATAAGTTTLTDASTKVQEFTGASNQTVVLPDATTLSNGRVFTIHNNSSGIITINANGGTQVAVLANLTSAYLQLINNGTAAGSWDVETSHEITETASTSSVTGFATDTYLAGSYLKFPFSPIVGTTYKLTFDVTKTAAGTATPIITIRTGTLGTTGDTARNTFTFGAGTAAADTGIFEVMVVFRTVGATTTAVTQSIAKLTNNLTITGISNAVKARTSTSSGFNSTTAALGIGASYNGGASASHTVTLVKAEIVM